MRTVKDLESLVEARTRELSALSTHLQELAEEEKSELARNLHDELGGLLTAAKMDLSWVQSRVTDPALQERLAQLGGVLDEAMDLKRRVVEDLRPSLLDHFGLPTALRAYVDSACAKAGLRAELELPEDAAPMAKDTAIALFRIVQEGVTNIIRHAGARSRGAATRTGERRLSHHPERRRQRLRCHRSQVPLVARHHRHAPAGARARRSIRYPVDPGRRHDAARQHSS